jgi:hypothetical protein
MDPVSIIGGIAAVGQVAGTATKCVKALYEISYEAGVLAEEIELFAAHVDVFAFTISNAHSTIRDHYQNDNRSSTIHELHKHGILRKAACQSRHVVRRVKELRQQLMVYEAAPHLWARILWVWRREKRNSICLWMDRIQAHFQLMMTQVTYEILKRRAANPSALDRRLFDFEKEM